MLRLCKCFRDFGGIAIVIVERDVVRHLVEHKRRARLYRFGWLEHHGQRFDVERDSFGRIFGLRHGFCDHAGNRIAHETHLITSKCRPWRVADRRSVTIL